MKVLFVHHSILPDGFVHMGLSILSAFLKKEGHEIKVFDTFDYENEEKLEKLSPLFKSVKEYHPKKNIFEGYKEILEDFSPDVVGFTVTKNEMRMVEKLINITNGPYIVVGGPQATTVPEEVIQIKKVNAICRGEGENPMKELLECLNKNISPKNIKNMWIKEKGLIYRNPLREFIEINDLPFMDYDIYNKEILIKPFLGKEYVTGQVEMTRGCPYNCAYCINSYLHKIYHGLGPVFRRKEPERMIEEMIYLKEKHNLEFIRFGDENFLGQPVEELRKFAEMYNLKVNLPFIVATRPETITIEKMEILKTMPCKQVSLGIEHGNEEFRGKILNRFCTNESILKGFKLLREYGIRSGAYIMIGFPTETEDLIRDSFDLVLDANPDIVAVYFFRPYDKTPLMDLCKEKNLLIEGKENVNYFTDSMVKGIPSERLEKLRDDFYEEFKKKKAEELN